MTFEDFYGAFPRKRSKGDARKAWDKIPPMLHDEIMAAVEAQKAHNWRGKESRWIPYPGTWLRAEGWLDAIEDEKPKGIAMHCAQPVIDEAEADRDFRRFMGMEPL